jgi:N4-gp56 family major capsid protein
MALTGKSQVANINSYYDRTFLERALPLLVFTKWGQVRNIPRNNSGTIKFRKYNSLNPATTALTEGVTPEGSQLSVTDSSATVKNYGDYVTLSDKLKMETEDPVETEATEVLGEQAAETLDELARDILYAGTNVQYADAGGDGNSARTDIASDDKISADLVKKAVRTLKNNKAKKVTQMVPAQVGYNTTPVDACYVGIVHPDTSYDLKALDGFKTIEKYRSGLANGPMPGEVGKLDEVRFVETTQAKVWSDGGASSQDVYGTLILGQNAYGTTRISGDAMRTIRKQLGEAGSADPLNQRATIGWKATFVAKILQQDFMLRLEHATSFDS